ncbi:helix-turn-helix domain-containing protein [Nonomuraea salmonea]|uniref:helix-turn-helix domain-containing protein n=1 Tax=Nonomuraea salmonea TaxID=46181 RepID=UPI002FE9370A
MDAGDNALAAVGVDVEDERLYRDLLRHPRTTLPELAEHTGRTAVALRRALSRLEALGLVSRMAGRPARFLATRPDVAVAALISRREEGLAQARLASIALLAETPSTQNQSPEELVEVVRGAGGRGAAVHAAAADGGRGAAGPRSSPRTRRIPASRTPRRSTGWRVVWWCGASTTSRRWRSPASCGWRRRRWRPVSRPGSARRCR